MLQGSKIICSFGNYNLDTGIYVLIDVVTVVKVLLYNNFSTL